MIEILVPVLARPERVKPFIEALPEKEIRITFIASEGDQAEIDALDAADADWLVLTDPGDHEYARKINLAAANSHAEWFLLGADDIRFHPGWVEAALRRAEETSRRVIGTNDLGNATVMAGNHATHSLVHRSYMEDGTIDEPGKLLHEGYHHNWVDSEFVETAKKRGEWAFAPDCYVEHLHPFWRKGPDDAVYLKGRETYALDQRLFQKRRRLWR